METIKRRMNVCWEILLSRHDLNDFTDLMNRNGFGGFTTAYMAEHCWILCYPSEDVKIIAKLRFDVTELPYYGTEIDFTDYPSP